MTESFSAAKTYERSSSDQQEEGYKLKDLLAPEKGSTVLDIGCGTGNLTKALADLVGPEGKVVGIEPNTERLEVACKKYSASNIEYIEGSAEDIPGVDGIDFYDYAFSNFVLHWCKNKDKVFKEVNKILKKGGKFGFVAGTYIDPAKVMGPDMVSSEFLAALKERFFQVTMEEYMQHATNNDFEVLHAEESSHEWKFADIHKYIDTLRMHMHGDFDMSHFNVDAGKKYFGEGEITIPAPFGIAILKKK